jgi:ankyrin repeat protein
MSRVKIQKTEIWDNDLPTVCMICGVKPGQTKSDTMAIHVPFPLSVLGIMGNLISWKKMPFPVVTCNECKQGYDNEANMSKVFGVGYTLCWFFLLFTVATQSDKLPKALLGPVIFLAIVAILHGLYFWTIGKKYAIRCVGMDGGNVSFEFPGGMWGVAYTTYKREKADRRLGRSPAARAPAAASDTPEPTDQGPPPAGAPMIGHAPEAPSAPVVEPKSGGGGIALDGDDNGRIPGDLPEFLAAVKEGDTDKIGTIISGGGDAGEALPNGMNGLHIACIAGLMQVADMLIRRGVSVNSEMANGLTPMHLAVQSNNQSMVGLLLAKKGDPNHANHDGRTPLHWCAAVRDSRLDPTNRFKMAQVLVKGGGDINARDKNGKTPAELAEEGGEGKVAQAFS